MSSGGDQPSAIVVGAGVFGASTASALARRGWAVQIIERYIPGHARSSSHDTSRLLRLGHGDEDLPDNWYTRSALESRRLWLEIGEEAGTELFVPCGALWFARSSDGFEARSAHDLRALGIAAEILPPGDAARFFPDVRHEDLAFVLHEPLAGVLRATTCVRTLIRRAIRDGAVLRAGRAEPHTSGVTLDGRNVGADRVVWACGPWLPAIFPGRVSLSSVKQSVFYFAAPSPWSTPPCPAWVEDDADAYGTGDLDGVGFKAVFARPYDGPFIDPDDEVRAPEADSLAQTRAALAHRFPALAKAHLTRTNVCQYEMTPDQHFIVAPIDDGRQWVVGGGSGQGFKHGPALGEYVADLLEARIEPRTEFGLEARARTRFC